MLSSEHGYDGHRKKSRKTPGTCEYLVCNDWKLTPIFLAEEHVLLLFSSRVRGASRGSVWLSWQAPLHRWYSELKLIKYKALSMQVANAGGLEEATAGISLLTLHSTRVLWNSNTLPCRMTQAPLHETIYDFEQLKLVLHRTHVFRNFLLWQCQLQCKQSCQKLIHCHWALASHAPFLTPIAEAAPAQSPRHARAINNACLLSMLCTAFAATLKNGSISRLWRSPVRESMRTLFLSKLIESGYDRIICRNTNAVSLVFSLESCQK